MGHLDYFITDLALILVASGLVTVIFRKIKLPVVLGYIIAGFLISPHFVWIPTVVEVDNVNTWANIGIVFLMFALGLEFSFKKIATVGVSAIITAVTVMGAMIIIGTITGRLLGFDKLNSLFLGGMISMSSTMIIIKAFEELHLKGEKFASLVMGTLVVEDIGGIFMIIILSTLSVGKDVSGGALFQQIGILLLFLIIWLVLGIYLIPTILRKISHLLNDETLLIVSLAICFAMVVISWRIGFSEALGAFISGSILAGTVKGNKIDKLIKPLKDLFGAVFFVSVGMMVVPETLAKYIVPIIVITAVTIVGQMVFATIGIIFSGCSLHTAIKGGFSMVQIGEFSFIIASLGVNLGVTKDYLYPVIVCVSVITIFTTPIFMKNSERVYNAIMKILPARARAFLRRYTTEKENTGNNESNSDWMRFLKRYISRTLIAIAALFLIYVLSKNYLGLFLSDHLDGIVDEVIATVVTCAIMMTPISLMMHRKSNIFVKLWIKSVSNRLPLTLLRGGQMAISAVFIMLTCRYYLHLTWFILVPVGLIFVLLITRSDFLKGQAIRVEARFIANFNEKILHKRKENSGENKWMDDKLCVGQFLISNAGKWDIITDLYNKRLFDLTVIKIIRNGKSINIPGGNEILCDGDQVHIMGTRDQLEAYVIILEKEEHIDTPLAPCVTMKEYLYGQIFNEIPALDQIMFVAVLVTKDSTFVKKQIKNSGFREKYQGLIAGIDRYNYPIVNPRVTTVIDEGDVLWIVGTEKMAEKLLADGLIE